MTDASGVRITPRLIIGLGILALGLLWTLDNLDVLESERLTDWWPLIVIGAGLARLFDPRAGKIGTAVIIFIGALLLGDTLDLFNVDPGDFIPLAIAALGAKLVWDALGRRERPRGINDQGSDMSTVAIMAAVKRQSTSSAFRGADASAIMGGVEIDLRNAKIADGEQAVIDAFALWGGVEIKVPENWRVDGRVFPLLGGFEDKTTNRSDTGPVLVVRGAAVMGGVEVKN